jgi:hypothetical protein
MTFPGTLLTAIVTLFVAGGTQLAGADHDRAGTGSRPVVVVTTPELAADPAIGAAVDRAGAQLRAPRTATEQLSVTHLFAARGDAIVGAGLSRRVAVEPVAERYPGARFRLVGADPSPDRLRAAIAAASTP